MSDIKIYIHKNDDNVENYSLYLNDYYLPIIGAKGAFLYRFFKESTFNYMEEERLINLLSLSKIDYNYNRKMLEAIGLISTFIKEDEEIIILKPVLPPSYFFNEEHLRKILLVSLNNDENAFKKIEEKYQNKLDLDGFNNISASLLDIFNIKPENNEKEYRFTVKNDKSDDFSLSTFYSLLRKNSQISAKLISKNDEERIKDLASLYSLDEKEMTKYINIYFDINNSSNHIKFKEMEKEIIKNSMIPSLDSNLLDNNLPKKIKTDNELINFYNSMSPLDFLKSTLNGKEPSQFEKSTIMMLANDYHFDKAMINALLDYSLKKNNNHIYKNNVRDYANYLVREEVIDVYSLLEALYNKDTIKETYSRNKKREEKIVKKEEKIEEIDTSNIVDFDDDEF